MKEFLMFKAGDYPQGKITKEQLDAFSVRFNASGDQISIFIGHRPWGMSDDDELAHGWISTIRVDGAGKVFAVEYEFDDYARAAIAKGQLKKCSVEISGEGTASAPYEITGLALLGRTTPAVRATFLPALFGKVFGSKETPSLPFYWGVESLDVTLFTSADTNEEVPMTEQEKRDFEKLKTDLADAETKNAAYAKAAVDRDKAALIVDAEAYFGALVTAGKLPPAHKDVAIAADLRCASADERITYRQLFGGIPALSGHFATTERAPAAPLPVGEAEVRAIKAYQTEHQIETFGAAAEAYYRATKR